MADFDIELSVARAAAIVAGGIVRDSYGRLTDKDISEKAANDMVTTVDLRSQDLVIDTLRTRFPDDYIVAEENLDPAVNDGRDPNGSRRWIIDPLDGTTNYIHGYPMFAVSIALEVDGEICVGVTHAPLSKETYYASRGGGAFLDGVQIHVSTTSANNRILLGTGFPFRARHFLDNYLKTFAFFFKNSRGIRRAGSAALDFAFVAAGRLDGFWEMTLSPWDVAAGVVLVREAGGQITDFFGGENHVNEGHVVASNGLFHEWMCEEIEKVFPRDTDFKRRS